MARAKYLADTSAFTRVNRPNVAATIGPLIAEGCIALCGPVAFELGFTARSGKDYDAIMARIDAFESAPATAGDHQRALGLQRMLAQRGHHRALSLVDALVAAIAESRDLTILHYDAHFDLVSDLTGQPSQWIVQPGAAD
ncbi:MAG: PIN domain nuclease [Actinobacteria bacterium]|nr:PIN domain nuclease [Actinomycetota bacterium]